MIVYFKFDVQFHDNEEPKSISYDLFDEDNEPLGWIVADANGEISYHLHAIFPFDRNEVYNALDYKPLHHAIAWFFERGILLDWSHVDDENLPEGIKR